MRNLIKNTAGKLEKTEDSITQDSKAEVFASYDKYSLRVKESVATCTMCSKERKVDHLLPGEEVPDDWNCSMIMIDGRQGDCKIPSNEKGLDFHPGEVVLAKMANFAWWPALIDEDPDEQNYYYAQGSEIGYHVSFFGNKVTRSWLNEAKICKFSKPPTEKTLVTKDVKLKKAIKDARLAETMPIRERFEKYGFASRYTGKIVTLNHDESAGTAKQPPKKSKSNAASTSSHSSTTVPSTSLRMSSRKRKPTTKMECLQKKKKNEPKEQSGSSTVLMGNLRGNIELNNNSSTNSLPDEENSATSSSTNSLPDEENSATSSSTNSLPDEEESATSSSTNCLPDEEESSSSNEDYVTLLNRDNMNLIQDKPRLGWENDVSSDEDEERPASEKSVDPPPDILINIFNDGMPHTFLLGEFEGELRTMK